VAHVIAVSPQVGDLIAIDIEMTSTPGPAGLAELYERHHEAVFRAAFRITGNSADAEDVLQTVFLRVLSGGEPEASAERPAAYFRRAAVNAAIDLLRRRAVHAATAYDDQAPHAAVEPALLLKHQLRRAIAILEPNDASLFLLRFVEGLSNEELADLFQLEKNNVAVRLHRIRVRLQEELNR
jgi:RNA polymerase sigma-70 factor, ECF subfamily